MAASGAAGERTGPSQRAIDIGIVVGVALVMTLTISVAAEEGASRSPDAFAYAFGLAIALVLLMRRRWPLHVFAASVCLLLVYFMLGYPGFSSAVPLAVASYSAAAAGHMVAASSVLAGFTAVGVAWQTVTEGIPLLTVLGGSAIANVALLAAVLLLGEAVRHRRAWSREVQERVRHAEQDRAIEATRRLEEERLRIARELHDVLAHTIAAVSVQAGVAVEVIDDSPDQARSSLQTIREQTREAIHELRAMVALLRGGSSDVADEPAPGLGELDSLIRFANEAGLEVERSITGTVRPLPRAIELIVYRIVQESLTNVVSHAHASKARVLLHFGPSALVVRVEDDGRGDDQVVTSDGHGLIGMRERAIAVGGTFTAGPLPNGGFFVSAYLPTGAS